MNTRFKNALMKTMIEKKEFMPIRDEEGRIVIREDICILTKEAYGSRSIVELLDGDKLTQEEIAERLQRSRLMLSEIKAKSTQYFFEIIIFDGEPDQEKLKIIEEGQYHEAHDKKYLKCISVNLSSKETRKHFKTPVGDMGLSRTIVELMKNEVPNVEIDEIYTVAHQREKDYELEFKVKTPIVTYTLIAINVLVFLLLYLHSTNSGISYDQLLIDYGAKENSRILAGEYWRFITPIFLHANLMHLLINCYSLYIIGISVERIFGRTKFLTVYMIAGILGNIGSFMFSTNPGVGASGAIFGLLGGLLYFGLEKPVLFRAYFGYNVIITIVINLVYGFSNSGIDNYAHIGGLIGGFLSSGFIAAPVKQKWYLNRGLFLVLTIIITLSGVFYGFNNNQNKILSEINQLQKLDDSQNWSGAEAKAGEILKLSPKEANVKEYALLTITRAEALQGKSEAAIEHAKLLTKLNPQKGHYILGAIYFDMKKYDLSKTELLEAKKAGATYSEIDKLLKEMK